MGKVLKIYLANKGFLFRMYEELIQIKRKKKTYSVIQKMDKTFEQSFPKKYIHMINEHIKKIFITVFT